jgi:two-component system cell cycle response regulator
MRGDKQKILASGFDGYVSKPIDPEQFVSQVEYWLPAR